jgi:hypothetical protein
VSDSPDEVVYEEVERGPKSEMVGAGTLLALLREDHLQHVAAKVNR